MGGLKWFYPEEEPILKLQHIISCPIFYRLKTLLRGIETPFIIPKRNDEQPRAFYLWVPSHLLTAYSLKCHSSPAVSLKPRAKDAWMLSVNYQSVIIPSGGVTCCCRYLLIHLVLSYLLVYKEIRTVGLLAGVAGKGVMKHESIINLFRYYFRLLYRKCS